MIQNTPLCFRLSFPILLYVFLSHKQTLVLDNPGVIAKKVWIRLQMNCLDLS